MSEEKTMNEEKALSDEELSGVSGGEGVPWSNRKCSNCGISETRVVLRNAEGPDEFGLYGSLEKLLCPTCFEDIFRPQGWEWL